MSFSTTFSHRVIPTVLITSLALTITACSPSTPAPEAQTQSSAAAGVEDTQSNALPSYERKRGEALESIVEEMSDSAQSGTYTSKSLPVTMVFHDVRGGEHTDFYRVVVEFKRDKNPEKRPEDMPLEYAASWVDAPVSQGKGDVLDNSGKAFLDINIPGTTMPAGGFEPLYYSGEKNLKFGSIDVSVDGSYEGNTHLIVGMDKKREYGMTILEGPTRLVIDIKK